MSHGRRRTAGMGRARRLADGDEESEARGRRRRRPGFNPAGSPGEPAARVARPYRFCSCGEPMFRNVDGSWQCRECDF